MDTSTITIKGQVVIPKIFRENLGIETGSKLLVLSDGTNLLLKPMEEPRLDAFKRLINESRRYAKAAGLKREDVPQVIRKVRNASRN